jgi:hypothetical protein
MAPAADGRGFIVIAFKFEVPFPQALIPYTVRFPDVAIAE